MLQHLITSLSFLTGVLIPVIVTLAIFIILWRYWDKSFVSDPSPVNLHSESLRNPINTGITVASLVIPIISSLVAYLYIKVSNTPTEFSLLISSLVLFSLSIIVGIWNNYSFATLTKSDGTLEISKETNTSIPAFFVSQLVLLLSAIILVVVFCFFQLSYLSPTTKKLENSDISILRQPLRINMTNDYVVSLWGLPAKEIKKGKNIIYIYQTPNSSVEITISNKKVIRILEQ